MKRYWYGGVTSEVEDDNGRWVKYEDVIELVGMLKELEFIQQETDESNYEYCPICEALRFAGHLTTCRLAALLKREVKNEAV